MYYRGFYIDISSDCSECKAAHECPEWRKKASCGLYTVGIYESEQKEYEFNSFDCSNVSACEDTAMQLIDNFHYEYIEEYLDWIEDSGMSPSNDFMNRVYSYEYIYD